MNLLTKLMAHPSSPTFCKLILEMWGFWFREEDFLANAFSLMNKLSLFWLLFRVEFVLDDYCYIYYFRDFILIVDNIDFYENINKINITRFHSQFLL